LALAPALKNGSKKVEAPNKRLKEKEETAEKERGASLLSCENLIQPQSVRWKSQALCRAKSSEKSVRKCL
jgi:hypothetical protein